MRTIRDIGTEYLFQCKDNYFDGLRPANKESRNTDGYKRLVELAHEFFSGGKLDEFAGFFLELQYSVNLWTAHLIVEYGNPNQILFGDCIEIIKRYSTTPLDEELAKEEKEWLQENNIE